MQRDSCPLLPRWARQHGLRADGRRHGRADRRADHCLRCACVRDRPRRCHARPAARSRAADRRIHRPPGACCRHAAEPAARRALRRHRHDQPIGRVERHRPRPTLAAVGAPGRGARARQRPVVGSLHAEGRRLGSLTVYRPADQEFTREDVELGQVLAHQASIALRFSKKLEGLTAALASRTVIGQAQGVLIERYKVGPDRAFEILKRFSQEQNVRLVEIARGLVSDVVSAQQ
ncbi:ANTAR domain-containing protein [Aeromicrobium sp. UC242_57]|uniref:ANTAR domain-containing protein n=1 Tax=Aeromicrobium sp. UC242_57 TaxID=3374624 RepID=UPI0037BF3B8A